MNYTPPEGYYDLPFTWTYDASGLTDGSSYPNQFVYLLGGYGDFIMRRAMGFDRVLNPATGKFWLRDKLNAPLESSPVFGGPNSGSQLAILPELEYPETGSVRFDLQNVLRTTEQTQVLPIYSAQVGFQGVRRLKGSDPFRVNYRYTTKPFWYQIQTAIPVAQDAAGQMVGRRTVKLKIDDYPFELWEMRIVYAGHSSGQIWAEGAGTLQVNAVPPGAAGDGITVTTIYTGLPGPALSITTVGPVITITMAGVFGVAPTTVADVVALINSDPAASQLVTASVILSGLAPQGSTTTAGGGVAAAGVNSALSIYDQDKQTISNAPVLDTFVNRLSALGNGALVPPLLYRKDGQLQIDIQSLTATPLGMTIYLLGRQRFPC